MKFTKLFAAVAALGALFVAPANATLVTNTSPVTAAGSPNLIDETHIDPWEFLTAETQVTAGGAGTVEFSLIAGDDMTVRASNSLNPAAGLAGLVVDLWVNANKVESLPLTGFGVQFMPIYVLQGDVIRFVANWTGLNSTQANLDFTLDGTPVPVPAAGLIFLTGLAGLRAARKRKAA